MRAMTVVVLGLALAGWGCARQVRTERVPVPAMDHLSWTGKPIGAVLEVWGRPSERLQDGEGGTILVYQELDVVGTRQGFGPSDPSPHQPPESAELPQTDLEMDPRAKFWVDAEGMVYRYWFSPATYRKGVPSPPRAADSGPS
jgi:hypothetical protein